MSISDSVWNMAIEIIAAFKKSNHSASSVVVFGIIPNGSQLLSRQVIQNDLTPEKLKDTGKYFAAVRIPLSVLSSVTELAEVLAQFKNGSIEDDFFLIVERSKNVSTFHQEVIVMSGDRIIPVIYRKTEYWDEEQPNTNYRGIFDIVFRSEDVTSIYTARRLKRAIRLVFGS